MNRYRLASVLALSLTALAASAQVTYTFSGTGASLSVTSFSFTTPTYLAATTTVATFAAASPNVGTATFEYASQPGIAAPNLRIADANGPGVDYYYFNPGTFTTNGVYAAGGNPGTLTFSGQPVPEPASLAALGLGAAAVLRRRKKA